MTTAAAVRRLRHPDESDIERLADVLIDCVEGGASVSFMAPLSRDRARAFWRRVVDDADGICGTVQVLLDLPENQPHRADIAKMLVHRRARRRGLGAALLRAAEQAARDSGRTLLVLDTVTRGDGERLYARLGWTRVGVIPGYALFPAGGYCDTTLFYRQLHHGT